jgi:hypothetical protein
MIKKTTKFDLLFTILAIAVLLIIGFSIVPNKPEKFENNHKYKKVDKEVEKIYTIPCKEAESCKG